jgi:hypothetical protein
MREPRMQKEEDHVRLHCLELASHYGASDLSTATILEKAAQYLKFVDGANLKERASDE